MCHHLLLVSISLPFVHMEADPAIFPAQYPTHHYCSDGGECVPHVACVPQLLGSVPDSVVKCYLDPDTTGVCCYPQPSSYKKRGLLRKAVDPPDSRSPHNFDSFTLNHAAKVGQFEVAWVSDFEKELKRRKTYVYKGSPSFNHFAFFKSKSIARKKSDESAMIIYGSQSLAQRFSLTADQAGFGLTAFSTNETLLGPNCPKGGPCNEKEKFRNYDGSCNNIENPLWGSSGSAFQRMLLPNYSDGVFRPRKSKSGDNLPSSRLVSINVIPDVDTPSELDTHNLMQWGQFVDHDITHTPVYRLGDNNSSGIQCCLENGSAPIDELILHPECYPISIPSNDPFFKQHNQRCMNFVRSMPAPQLSCTFGYGEQMNQITHFHDGSNVYGSDEEDATDLREYSDGLMRVNKDSHSKGLLPQAKGELEGEECGILKDIQESMNRKCFEGGDSRSNEQPGLTAYHTVWLREHNRLAKELKNLNPNWSDERLYQESRKILIAELQHITYNEWLPIILGVDFMDELDILPIKYGYSSTYDRTVDPSIINSFATAAFRFGHTLIQGHLDLVEDKENGRKKLSSIPLSATFFNPETIYTPGQLDKFLVGLATQPRQRYDNVITDQVTNHLFQPKNKSFGMDLIALNLQRGRDHGLPGYNAFREICGLKRMTSFEALSDLIPGPIVERFKLIYKDVDDIDLFIGGISELSVAKAVVGPTFQCLIGDQFKRLNHGDRFFYDHSDNPGKFSESQLKEIRHTSLARITCDNGDDIQHMQPLTFRRPSDINPLVSCDSIAIPRVNLLPWKEESPIQVSSLPKISKLTDNSISASPSITFYDYEAPEANTKSLPRLFPRSFFPQVNLSQATSFVHSRFPTYYPL